MAERTFYELSQGEMRVCSEQEWWAWWSKPSNRQYRISEVHVQGCRAITVSTIFQGLEGPGLDLFQTFVFDRETMCEFVELYGTAQTLEAARLVHEQTVVLVKSRLQTAVAEGVAELRNLKDNVKTQVKKNPPKQNIPILSGPVKKDVLDDLVAQIQKPK